MKSTNKLSSSAIALTETLYNTLRPLYSPTPIYEINQTDDYIEVNFLDGRSNLQLYGNSLEITAFDILVATLFLEDVNILFEGITGVGKSYVTDMFFQSLFSDKSFYIDRANVNPFVESSVLTPFLTTRLENNIPKQFINEDQTKSIGAVFVEEVNRREINDLLSLLDKKLTLNGKRSELGIPFPNSNDLKKIIIIGSQNPVDDNHGSVQENDIAEDNRFLKIPFPNAIAESGSGQIQFSEYKDLHTEFWDKYRTKIESKAPWQELYVQATDMRNFSLELSSTHREFIDLMLSYIERNPKLEIERNQSIINQSKINVKFHLRENESLQKIIEVQSTLKYPIVRRDLNKIMNFSKLVALIRSIKQKNYSPTISLVDIISSFGVLLEGRKIGILETSMFDYVNDSLQSYKRLKTIYKIKDNKGIRESILSKSINNYLNSGKDFNVFSSTLQSTAEKFGINQHPSPSMSVFNSKIIADLVILENFSQKYKETFVIAMNSSSPRQQLGDLYTNNLATLPSIFVNRLHWLVENFRI